jgi:hypothetical protein
MAVRLSALRDGRLCFNTREISGIHSWYTMRSSQGHSVVGRIRSLEKFNDLIGNRTRDLPACSIMLQPTRLSRANTPCSNTELLGIQDKHSIYTRDFVGHVYIALRCVESFEVWQELAEILGGPMTLKPHQRMAYVHRG